MNAVIYHNPNCGTSRNTLAMLRHVGIEPEVIDYLAHPPSRARLIELITAAGLSVRDAIRQKGTPYDALGLGDPALSDDALLDAMLAHPILINRPFVQTALGTRLCRPSEVVLEILPPMTRSFTKEDGEVVEARQGS
ncbi:arsenate reductase (glutaredoxin) [Stenotrophomonas rhizophila]|uniref:arsenate reductase (glutaredoxin) n=1 Tax=Stenotrophomonas rhizophila TaxID=216778 RepID=UPI0028D30C68|nr:arsenate reductase (glutaredoxin) [Stenotrophomonas rhizophila]